MALYQILIDDDANEKIISLQEEFHLQSRQAVVDFLLKNTEALKQHSQKKSDSLLIVELASPDQQKRSQLLLSLDSGPNLIPII